MVDKLKMNPRTPSPSDSEEPPDDRGRRKRLVCRRQGCKEAFAHPSSRERHERDRCPVLQSTSDRALLQTEYLVPSHNDLQLDPLLCRFPGCLKPYSQISHRRRHEQDKHQMTERNGITMSSSPFPTDHTVSVTNLHQSVSLPSSPTFLTPERPIKKKNISIKSYIYA